MRHLLPALVFCALTMAACSGGGSGNGVNIKTVGSTRPVTAADRNKSASLKGRVLAPKGYKAENARAVTKFGLLDDANEAPLAGVEVYLASGSGERYRGPVASTTNLNGEFEIKSVPYNLTFLVMTNTLDPELHHAEFCGMARSLGDGANIEVSYATTVITKSTVNTTPTTVTATGSVTPATVTGNALGTFDPTLYINAVAAVKAQIDFTQLTNLEQPGAVEAILAKVNVGGVPLTTTIASLRGGLFANGITSDSVQDALNGLNINFAGTGSTSVNGQTTGSGSTQGTIGFDPSQVGNVLGGLLGTPAPTAAPTVAPTAAPAPPIAPTTAPSATPTAVATTKP